MCVCVFLNRKQLFTGNENLRHAFPLTHDGDLIGDFGLGRDYSKCDAQSRNNAYIGTLWLQVLSAITVPISQQEISTPVQ